VGECQGDAAGARDRAQGCRKRVGVRLEPTAILVDWAGRKKILSLNSKNQRARRSFGSLGTYPQNFDAETPRGSSSNMVGGENFRSP